MFCTVTVAVWLPVAEHGIHRLSPVAHPSVPAKGSAHDPPDWLAVSQAVFVVDPSGLRISVVAVSAVNGPPLVSWMRIHSVAPLLSTSCAVARAAALVGAGVVSCRPLTQTNTVAARTTVMATIRITAMTGLTALSFARVRVFRLLSIRSIGSFVSYASLVSGLE